VATVTLVVWVCPHPSSLRSAGLSCRARQTLGRSVANDNRKADGLQATVAEPD